ncbi:MAG: excinuclease ABC subunit UvrA [Bacteroidota bacterium]|nr:excinuclease ABC subunit UvrA [Bacteroidota bacterium]
MSKSSTISQKAKTDLQNANAPAPSGKAISIRGARVHNLKNIGLDIPRNKLVVITGVSGSGKSSLAFDTIYAEGQRRYVESLSAYARQFLERMDKPDVDMIQGLSPAIAIEQKTNTRNPRSTVATTTEVYDYLRLFFARIGKTYCEACGKLVARDSVHTVVDRIAQFADGAKFYIAFPLPNHESKSARQEVDALKKRGFFRFVVGGAIIDVNEKSFSPKEKKDVFVLVDRFVLRKKEKESGTRLADSIQTAFEEGEGYAAVFDLEAKTWLRFNQHFECPDGHVRYEEPTPQLFSFNSPVGACPKCQGFGRSVGLDMDLIVPDKNKTLRDGAIQPWTTPKFKENLRDLLAIAYEANVPVNVPFSDLTDAQLNVVMNGYGRRFDGINGFFKEVERKSYKIQYRVLLSKYRGYTTCDECGGSRLRKEARCVKVNEKTIGEIVRMTIEDADAFFKSLSLTDFEMSICRRILDEIQKRLRYLVEVGLGYLTLDRLSSTLSGGESQRINLATSLGSSLVGSVYVLDEPSIGLHPVDNDRLIRILKSLRDLGNTIIVVEHDADMMRAADVLVDMGPSAGERGGEVTFFGTAEEAAAHPVSLTGKYLSGELCIPVPASRRKKSGKSLKLKNAFHHNLKNIDVEFPLNMLVCITGVSGSGKSTLVHDVLFEGIKKRLETKAGLPAEGRFRPQAGRINGAADLLGVENLSGVELVDQSPIGRTPRSNAVTYIKAFDVIRDLLANTQTAKVHGYQPGFFSFNVPGGRCEVCEGDGVQKIEMQFMADLYLVCESCKGKRYKEEALAVRYDGKNVDDILSMTVNEAIEFFSRKPTGKRVAQKLKVLDDVGLGYLRLGQAATTLSGGEAQRVKLAAHLSSEQEGHTLFIFDEPTTGLHFDDIAKLLKCFTALIEAGHSVLLIEHNLDVIKCADYLIDLGPGGGESGGRIIAQGTPEEVARAAASHTGKFLKGIA